MPYDDVAPSLFDDFQPFEATYGPARDAYSPTITLLSDQSVEDVAQRTADLLEERLKLAAVFVEVDFAQTFLQTTASWALFLFWILLLVIWVRTCLLAVTRLCCYLRSHPATLPVSTLPVAVPTKKVIESEV